MNEERGELLPKTQANSISLDHHRFGPYHSHEWKSTASEKRCQENSMVPLEGFEPPRRSACS